MSVKAPSDQFGQAIENCRVGSLVENVTGVSCDSASQTTNVVMKLNALAGAERFSIPGSMNLVFAKSFLVPAGPMVGAESRKPENKLTDEVLSLLYNRDSVASSWRSLLYEVKLYTDVISDIVSSGECMGFIAPYGASSCPIASLKSMFPAARGDEFADRFMKSVFANTFNRYRRPDAATITGTRPDQVFEANPQAAPILARFSSFSISDDTMCGSVRIRPGYQREWDAMMRTSHIEIVTTFMEAADGSRGDMTLADYVTEVRTMITRHTADPSERFILLNGAMNTVFLQIAFALYALDVNRVAHNDLHLGNLWIRFLPEPRFIKFQAEGLSLAIYTNVVVRIFDFDRGYAVRMGHNPLLAYTVKENQTNEFHRGKDMLKVFSYFLDCENRVRRRLDNDTVEMLSDLATGFLLSGVDVPATRDALTGIVREGCFLQSGGQRVSNPQLTEALGDPGRVLRFFVPAGTPTMELTAKENASSIIGACVIAANHDQSGNLTHKDRLDMALASLRARREFVVVKGVVTPNFAADGTIASFTIGGGFGTPSGAVSTATFGASSRRSPRAAASPKAAGSASPRAAASPKAAGSASPRAASPPRARFSTPKRSTRSSSPKRSARRSSPRTAMPRGFSGAEIAS